MCHVFLTQVSSQIIAEQIESDSQSNEVCILELTTNSKRDLLELFERGISTNTIKAVHRYMHQY